jgi:hypothetical protein
MLVFFEDEARNRAEAALGPWDWAVIHGFLLIP